MEHLFIFCEFLENEGWKRERHLFKPGFSPSYTALVIIHKFIGDPCIVTRCKVLPAPGITTFSPVCP